MIPLPGKGAFTRPSGGGEWQPAMAGPLHPPCRRKKLRPLRPRLTARTALCSVPSSSPHAAGRAGAPVFLPEENETAPAGACRRPTAAKRRLLGRRQTGRARSKREKEVYGNATGARLNEWRSQNDFPRAIGSHGGCSSPNGPAPLFAAAPRWLCKGCVYRASFPVRARWAALGGD